MSRRKPPPPLYHKIVDVPEDDEFIANHAEVIASDDGYWIFIECGDSQVMLTLPCAEKVHAALGEAIAAARKEFRGE